METAGFVSQSETIDDGNQVCLTYGVWRRIQIKVAICYRIAGHFKHAAKEGRA